MKKIFLMTVLCLTMTAWVHAESLFKVGRNIFRPKNELTVTIAVTPQHTGVAEIFVYNSAGEYVQHHVFENAAAGIEQTWEWDGTSFEKAPLASGIYILYLHTKFSAIVRRLIIAR